jgi:hypothetical protein
VVDAQRFWPENVPFSDNLSPLRLDPRGRLILKSAGILPAPSDLRLCTVTMVHGDHPDRRWSAAGVLPWSRKVCWSAAKVCWSLLASRRTAEGFVHQLVDVLGGDGSVDAERYPATFRAQDTFADGLLTITMPALRRTRRWVLMEYRP